MLASCAAFALSAAGSSAWVAGVVLLVAACLQVFGEMLQASGAWEIGFDLAPPDRQGQYQGFFGTGASVARMLGPLLLTTLIVTWGTPGWLLLGGLFLGASRWDRPSAGRNGPGPPLRPVAIDVESGVVGIPTGSLDAPRERTRDLPARPAGDRPYMPSERAARDAAVFVAGEQSGTAHTARRRGGGLSVVPSIATNTLRIETARDLQLFYTSN